MASKQSRIVELTNIISINTAKIDRYLAENSFPKPFFNAEGPASLTLTSELQDTREEVLNANLELQELLLGRKEVIADYQVNFCGGHTTMAFDYSTNSCILQLLHCCPSRLLIWYG